ncbi:hypothetical protein M1N59_00535 [Dehalococcoidales bacterium]|nr:hypothetical protein [Dehalococcoidales bacterium]
MPPLIKLQIIDDSKVEKCDAHCGVSSPEAIALASQRIKDRFGEGIKLAYLDLAKNPELNQQVRGKKLPLLLNDKPRI